MEFWTILVIMSTGPIALVWHWARRLGPEPEMPTEDDPKWRKVRWDIGE